MPYNIPKNKGGDSRENVAKMESCVNKIKGTNNRTGPTTAQSRTVTNANNRTR